MPHRGSLNGEAKMRLFYQFDSQGINRVSYNANQENRIGDDANFALLLFFNLLFWPASGSETAWS